MYVIIVIMLIYVIRTIYYNIYIYYYNRRDNTQGFML